MKQPTYMKESWKTNPAVCVKMLDAFLSVSLELSDDAFNNAYQHVLSQIDRKVASIRVRRKIRNKYK